MVVRDTEYNIEVPSIIGMNLIREFSRVCPSTEELNIPTVWKTAFEVSAMTSVGVVKSTKEVTIQPMETKTISGFVWKSFDVKSAVTETLENAGSNIPSVCPRVVSLENPGKTSRVPVRVCNLSARVLKIKVNTQICELHEVSVLRDASDTFLDHKPETEILTKDEPEKEILTSVVNSLHASEKESENESYLFEKEIKVKFGVDMKTEDLSEENQQQRVLNLFEKWKAIFPKSPMDLGHTSAVRHKIELLNNEPFKEPC